MNNLISEAYKTPSLTSQQKEFDQSISENMSRVSSKKNKVFEKFKSIVDSFMQFIRTYIIDKPKIFFKSLLTNKKKSLNTGDNINRFRLLIKECHEKSIPYKIHLCRSHFSFSGIVTSTYLTSINNIKLKDSDRDIKSESRLGDSVYINPTGDEAIKFLSEKTGISKEIIRPISELGFEYRITNKMYSDNIPSYVGKVEVEEYKFLQGNSLHAKTDEIKNVDIEYNGKDYILRRAQGIVSEYLPPRDLYCFLYTTKEEADKEIQESNKLLKAATE